MRPPAWIGARTTERGERPAGGGWVRGPLGAGAFGALTAGLCCLPAALAFALGVGGSAFLVGLGLYKLPFMALGLAVTTLVSVVVTRRSSTCAVDGRRTSVRAIALALLGFAVTYLALTYAVVPLLYQFGLGT